MINLETGKSTKDGENIRLGDIIQGARTHPMVVLTNDDCSEFICYIVNVATEKTVFGIKKTYVVEELITFPLEEILASWSDIKVVDNITFFKN